LIQLRAKNRFTAFEWKGFAATKEKNGDLVNTLVPGVGVEPT